MLGGLQVAFRIAFHFFTSAIKKLTNWGPMKRGMILLAMCSLLSIACSSGDSQNATKSGNPFFDKISEAYKEGAKHRTTTFKAEKQESRDCVKVEYKKSEDGRKGLLKVNLKKRSEEETGNNLKLSNYSNQTQSAKSLRPCED
jgi:hypothetical protein